MLAAMTMLFVHDESGATAIKYGLVAVLLAMAVYHG
jgi:Flp pilus assembly pilin Flp